MIEPETGLDTSNMLKRISGLPLAAQQMAIYGGALIVVKLFGVIMMPFFTNFLAPDQFAKLEVLQTLANLLSIVLGLGLAEAIFRHGAGDVASRREVTGAALAIACLSCLLMLLIGQAVVPPVAYLLPGDVTVLQVRFLFAGLALGPILAVALSQLRLDDRAAAFFFGNVGWVGLQGVLSISALYCAFGVDGVLGAGVVATFASVVVLGWMTYRRSGLCFRLDVWGRLGHFGSVCALAGVAAFLIDGFSRWVLASYVSAQDVAEFALAAKIGIMASFALQPHLMYWLPKRFAVLDEPDGYESSARMVEAGIVMGLVAAAGVMLVGPVVIVVLTPVTYHGAIAYVPALALLFAVGAATQLIQTGAMVPKGTLWPAAIEWSTAGIAVAAYFALIPTYGNWGGVGAFAVAVVLRFAAYLWIGNWYAPIPYRVARLSILFALACLCVGAMHLADGGAARASVALIGVVSVTGASFVLGLVPTAWLHEFQAVFARRGEVRV